MRTTLYIATLLWALTACGPNLPPDVAEAYNDLPEYVDFNFHVKPILSDRCYTCHGPDDNARKADLRLDTEEGAFMALTSGGHALVPGNLNRSLAVKRIISTDPEWMMPPPESNLSLNPREIALIAKWVEQGAEWKEHWSFITPEKPQVPAVDDETEVYSPIDHFIIEEAHRQGLELAPSASKERWLRRVTLDLTGLPPTPEEIKSFLRNDHADAYEEVVDRLLASPHYGERMALDWLDLARYADTHGYQDDGMRNTWPYRDWVIKAFNQNMPYDQFLIWQLAGDLLPNPSKEQLIATCFNRNHPQTQEGGVVDEEYRVEYVADRTNTFGKAFLGLTAECARCHDHKYDPISQKDYYSLYAFFNNNNDTGIVPYNGEASPTLILPSKEAEVELGILRDQMDSLENLMVEESYMEKLKSWLQQIPDEHALPSKHGLVADFDFEKEFKINDHDLPLQKQSSARGSDYQANYAFFDQAHNALRAKILGDVDSRPLIVQGKNGQGLKFRGDAGIRFHQDLDFDRHQPFSASIWVRLESEGEEGPIFNKTNGDFEGYRGWICKLNPDGTVSFQLNHVWPDNCIDIRTKEPLQPKTWYHITMTYDGSSRAEGLNPYINGEIPAHKVITDNLHKSILHGVKGSNWSYLPLMLGKENLKSIQDVIMDDFRVYDRELTPVEVRGIYEDKEYPVKDLTQQQQLAYYLQAGKDPEYNQLSHQLLQLRKDYNLLITDQPEIMIMRENPQVRATFVLDRGAYDAPADTVSPNTPGIFPSMPDSLPRNRLGLAQWLTQKENPLTARVLANRLWAQCFGIGLVATQEDFGIQGNLPTHPQLLDWLAVKLLENQWDIKATLKEIVLSATYRRSSVPTTSALEKDPENLYYAYYPAHRLPAEIIRDQALAAAGLLVPVIGGPSVYPYQPPGIWKALATRNATEYVQQHGDSLYRRSIYTVWKRSSPPPSMTNFDAPDRYYCVVRRQNTSTPLQSLVMMNDPQFMEAARMLGERMIKSGGKEVSDKINFGFQALVGRSARTEELHHLAKLYRQELRDFKDQPDRLDPWLSSGEHPIDESLDRSQLAAYTTIATTIMNFDEFTMKR